MGRKATRKWAKRAARYASEQDADKRADMDRRYGGSRRWPRAKART